MTDKHPYISETLQALLEQSFNGDQFVVLVELQEAEPPVGGIPLKRINQRKATMEADAAPVRNLVTRLGGTVVDELWTKRSLRCVLSPKTIRQLADLPGIRWLDRPHKDALD